MMQHYLPARIRGLCCRSKRLNTSISDFSEEGDDKQTGYRKTAMARSSATKFDSVKEEGGEESEDELSEGDF